MFAAGLRIWPVLGIRNVATNMFASGLRILACSRDPQRGNQHVCLRVADFRRGSENPTKEETFIQGLPYCRLVTDCRRDEAVSFTRLRCGIRERWVVGCDFFDKSDALLTAFDKVANSNSFLLRAPKKPGDLRRRFLYFVPSRAFKRELVGADAARDWHNYRTMNSKCEWVTKSGGFYNGGRIEFTKVLTASKFAGKLQRLLISGPCFYGHRYPETEVKRIVREFLRDFQPDNDEVLAVRPDFLFSHQYLGPEQDLPEKALCYFDGCGCDHCWTWLHNDELLVLLLSGTS